MAAELVAIYIGVTEAEVGLNTIPGAGPRVIVVLNQVELHQRGVGGAGRVQFDAGDVVLNDVVFDLVSTLRTRGAGVGPDPCQEAGIREC